MEKELEVGSTLAADQALYVDPARQQKLLRKLDLWLAPVMTLIFLSAYLNRANIGNASSAGMLEDVGMSSAQLGNAVTLFYVTYVSFEIPCTLIMKKLHPNRMLPLLTFGWSVTLVGTAFMKTVPQFYVSRLLLGLFESGLYPCLSLYLTTFYHPKEQGLRISYLLVSAALSGSFSGLFAYALLKMDGIGGLAGWRWLFLIEGLASIFVAIFIFLVLPNDFESAKFLSEEEKQLMRVRAEMGRRYAGRQDFNWRDVRLAVTDPKVYLSCFNQFCGDICSFGLSTFLPLIIKSFGYGTVKTQLFTIPVFFLAACAYIGVSWVSDRIQRRAFCMIPAAFVTMVGYAMQVAVPARLPGVLYFSTFLIAPGIYIIVGLNSTWLLNSNAGYYKRATAIGMNQSFGNSAGIVVGQIFKQKSHGKYRLGLSFSLGAVCFAMVGHATLFLYLRWQNKKRDALTEDERLHEMEHGKGGDFHPDFRYIL